MLFGSRLATHEEAKENVGVLHGVPILGLDALASASYGPEALMTVMLGLGAAAVGPLLPLSLVVIALLAIVGASYLQTIGAYPNGGGSFTVARENLGERWGAVAGAALGLDYLLNVAVAISSGVGALVSAVPALLPHTLALCLGVLAFMTIINIRGVRSTATAFMFPTYLFVGTVGGVLLIGIVKALMAHGHPAAVVTPPHVPQLVAVATPWLLVRAFSSGCTAMTGIEAVSNGVPIFREPRQRRARGTLITILVILMLFLAGIALVCRSYGIVATAPGQKGYESVLSQVTGAVVGRGIGYYVTIAGIVAVMALSANTSFADFPRVCRLLAIDHFLPDVFEHRGRRLVFSMGILVLSGCAAVLLVVFQGVTDKLIPLFAIGAFLAFTLSQAGMVVHWKRRRTEPRALAKLVMNAVGAVATGITTLVVLVAKASEGAWISVAIVASAVAGLLLHRRHVMRLREATDALGQGLDVTPLGLCQSIVPVTRWDRAARKALRLAMSICPDVEALQILTGDRDEEDLTARWPELVEEPARHAGVSPPKLTIVRSEYRELYGPLVRLVKLAGDRNPGRTVAVVVPEIVQSRHYRALLGDYSSTVLKELLFLDGGPRVIVMSAPFYLGEDGAEQAAAE
jgi:amino acid transporter